MDGMKCRRAATRNSAYGTDVITSHGLPGIQGKGVESLLLLVLWPCDTSAGPWHTLCCIDEKATEDDKSRQPAHWHIMVQLIGITGVCRWPVGPHPPSLPR